MGTDNLPSERTVASWICTSKPTADMNAKYAVALILALQVSVSLCDGPSQELLNNYNEMKQTFSRRLLTALGKIKEATTPLIESQSENVLVQQVKDFTESLSSQPAFHTTTAIVKGLAAEVEPLVEQARLALLGLYERHASETVREQVKQHISSIKGFLDIYLPVE